VTCVPTTAADLTAVRHVPGPAPRSARATIALPLAAIALTASLAGGIVGAAATVAVPTLTRDRAAEQAQWLDLVEELEEAARRDDLWQARYPALR